ncbi:MAG: helix-turn-helix domain-containing protein [Sedimentisphaerales bacterium]|nr:helix-turn-helix domain-containing protein [Sedimentisphaerales bacterium]
MGQKEKLLQIAGAAKEAGISRQSLQYYLMIGVLEPTEISLTGRRLFDDRAIENIRLIRKINKSGYPLRAIRELFMQGRVGEKGLVS